MAFGNDSITVVLLAVACCLLVGHCQGQSDSSLGCYYDGDGGNSARVLGDLIECDAVAGVCQRSCGPHEAYCESIEMTHANCKALCRDGNYQYYGLEGGNQCFCGGALASPFAYGHVANLANCTDPCSGNASRTCGGEFKIDIFEFHEPVKSPGCFFPAAVPNSIVDDVGVGTGETLTFRCLPGYQLIGSPDLLCMDNNTWSSRDLPFCNYTGVYPESTTVIATTTAKPTTEAEDTTAQDSEMAASTMAAEPETTSEPAELTSGTRAPSSTFTTDITQDYQSSVRDILPYIVAVSGALLVLLVIFLIAIFVHTNRKVKGNARRNISLKPADMAPVTLLNTGYTPAEDDPESAIPIPDILLDGSLATASRPAQVVENEYVGFGQRKASADSDSVDEISKIKGADQSWERPGAASGAGAPGQASAFTAAPGVGGDGSLDGMSEASAAPTATTYENVDGRWNSEETLASEEGRAFFADAGTTAATSL